MTFNIKYYAGEVLYYAPFTRGNNNSPFGVRDIPYASCVADILLLGDWELFTVKVNQSANIDCMCCGHKHLKYNYWIVRSDISESELRTFQSGTFKKADQSKQYSKKNPFLHNGVYVSAGMIDEHDKFRCVGSECVTRLITDDSTANIMKGVEAKRNQCDRQFKDKILRVQMRAWLERNETKLTKKLDEHVEKRILEEEAKAKLIPSHYVNTWRMRNSKSFFTKMLRQVNYWNPTTCRKLINDMLRSMGMRKSSYVPTAKLSKADKQELDEWKEKQMQIFVEGARTLFAGKYKDMKWCDTCKERVPRSHNHNGLNVKGRIK